MFVFYRDESENKVYENFIVQDDMMNIVLGCCCEISSCANVLYDDYPCTRLSEIDYVAIECCGSMLLSPNWDELPSLYQ